MLNNRKPILKDNAATMKRVFNTHAAELEKLAETAQKASEVDRGLAAAALYAADGNEAYAKQCRQTARQMREQAKEL